LPLLGGGASGGPRVAVAVVAVVADHPVEEAEPCRPKTDASTSPLSFHLLNKVASARPTVADRLSGRPGKRGRATRSLAEATSETLDIRRGGIRAAIATMQKFATPRVLVVDITGEEQPLSALAELAHVVELMFAFWSWV